MKDAEVAKAGPKPAPTIKLEGVRKQARAPSPPQHPRPVLLIEERPEAKGGKVVVAGKIVAVAVPGKCTAIPQEYHGVTEALNVWVLTHDDKLVKLSDWGVAYGGKWHLLDVYDQVRRLLRLGCWLRVAGVRLRTNTPAEGSDPGTHWKAAVGDGSTVEVGMEVVAEPSHHRVELQDLSPSDAKRLFHGGVLVVIMHACHLPVGLSASQVVRVPVVVVRRGEGDHMVADNGVLLLKLHDVPATFVEHLQPGFEATALSQRCWYLDNVELQNVDGQLEVVGSHASVMVRAEASCWLVRMTMLLPEVQVLLGRVEVVEDGVYEGVAMPLRVEDAVSVKVVMGDQEEELDAMHEAVPGMVQAFLEANAAGEAAAGKGAEVKYVVDLRVKLVSDRLAGQGGDVGEVRVGDAAASSMFAGSVHGWEVHVAPTGGSAATTRRTTKVADVYAYGRGVLVRSLHPMSGRFTVVHGEITAFQAL